MNKVLDFLERYVQWIALGLGGLFLAYMIWAYGVQTPVTVTGVGSGPLNPGEVDTEIANGPAKQLERAMHDTTVPPMTVPHFVDGFIRTLTEQDYKPVAMAVNWNAQTVPLPIMAPKGANDSQQQAPITALPVLTAATILDHSSGKSNVLPVGAPAVAPADPGAAPAGAPGGVPGVAPGGAPGVAVISGVDKAWVTVRYSISPREIADAFAKANIPNWTEHTCILQVQLNRQEELGSGQWSPNTKIEALNAPLLPPYPPATSEGDYLKWAADHPADLLQPAFLQVLKGDLWVLPGTPAPVPPPVVLDPLDPSRDYPPSVLQQHSPDEVAQFRKARQEFRKQQQQQRGNNRRSPAAPASPSGPDNPSPGGLPGRTSSTPGILPLDTPAGQPFGDQPGAPGANPAIASAASSLPHGEFVPRTFNGDIIGWAHDTTVIPGHTYRYMIVYTIKNPIYHTNAAKDPKLVNPLELSSAPSSWTEPISIATSTNYFLASNSSIGAMSARFKVFKWENGVEKMHVFEVAPGDVIGSKEGDTDFTTGSTVVALRFDDPKNPEMTVLIMNANGQLEERGYRSDQAKPELQSLTAQVAATAAPPSLAGGR